MNADERIALISVKTERAKKHINDLYAEVTAYVESRPYEISSQVQAQSLTHRIYYLTEVKPIPDSIRAIIGDVLFNARAALDHLAYHLADVRGFVDDNGVPLKRREISEITYPILDVETSDEYKADETFKRKVKGMSQMARDAIVRTKPYKGGDKPLWRLHRLHNIDKHRLVVTAASALHSVNLEPMRKFFEAVTGDYFMLPNMLIDPGDRRCPAEKGDKIYNDFVNPEVDQQIQPFFQVMLYEPGIVECEPLLETIHYMVDLVEHIVATFKPLLV